MTGAPEPQPMDAAPKNGGWVLAHVPKNAPYPHNHPWIILTWGDSGWVDDDGNEHEPVAWVPLPDPQPSPTGWGPAAGTIKMIEITGEGWADGAGKAIAVPWRWIIEIEKPDGTYDEYRDNEFAVTVEDAERRASKWHSRFGLPIVRVPLEKKVIPFPAGGAGK